MMKIKALKDALKNKVVRVGEEAVQFSHDGVAEVEDYIGKTLLKLQNEYVAFDAKLHKVTPANAPAAETQGALNPASAANKAAKTADNVGVPAKADEKAGEAAKTDEPVTTDGAPKADAGASDDAEADTTEDIVTPDMVIPKKPAAPVAPDKVADKPAADKPANKAAKPAK